MSFERWINYIQNADKSSIISGKVRKVHYRFNDGAEMVEEYSMDTGIIIRRAWKKKQNIDVHAGFDDLNDPLLDWDIEIGNTSVHLPEKADNSNFLVKESNTTPILTKRITRHNIEWRIRNLSYPLETYLITIDETKKSIIVRTTNKKYFKEINVPELSRCDIVPQQDHITVTHQHNTLIIQYRKPNIVIQMEQETLKILQNVTTETIDDI